MDVQTIRGRGGVLSVLGARAGALTTWTLTVSEDGMAFAGRGAFARYWVSAGAERAVVVSALPASPNLPTRFEGRIETFTTTEIRLVNVRRAEL